MIGLLAKKIGMTQIFDHDGDAVPVTVLEVGPCTVLDIKTKDKHGYQAVQLGFDSVKEKSLNKPELGVFKKKNISPVKVVKEIRTDNIEGLEVGKVVGVNNFSVGDKVDVIGTTIGRGFQGVVKRHGFSGGGRSHGSMFGRVAGSIGQNENPKRVFKGLKMSGQMGNVQTTIQSLKVEKIDVENNLLALHGAVPGPVNGYLVIREAIKKRRPRKWKMPGEAMDELKVEKKKVSARKKADGAKTAAKVAKPAAAAKPAAKK